VGWNYRPGRIGWFFGGILFEEEAVNFLGAVKNGRTFFVKWRTPVSAIRGRDGMTLNGKPVVLVMM
jgi:hypothetical protein